MAQRELLLLATLSVAAPGALHAAGERALDGRSVIVLCRETIDGQAAAGCTMEQLVTQLVRAEGGVLVAADQVDRVRKQLSPEQWQDPAGLKGVNLLDADIAVVLLTEAAAQAGLGKFKSYSVAVNLKVVAASSARILYERRLEGPGVGLNVNTALADARKRFTQDSWPAVATEMRERLLQPASCELWVFDVPNLKAAGELDGMLAGLDVVSSARRTAFTSGLGRWRLQLKSGKDIGSLANALESQDSVLAVQGVVGEAVQAAWRPTARVKLNAFVRVLPGSEAPPWFRSVMEDMVRSQLRGTGFIQVVDTPSAGKVLDVGVHVAKNKKGYAVKLVAARGAGKALATAVETAPEEQLPAALQRAVDGMLKGFKSWLDKSPGDLRELKDALAAPAALSATLELDGADGSLYAAQAERYAKDGVGMLRLSQPMQDVAVRARIGAGEWQAIPSVERTDAVRISLPLRAAQLRSFSRPATLPLEVELSARAGERLYKVSRSRPVVIYPIQAMRWSNPESYAVFIHPSAPWARKLVSSLKAPPRSEPSHAIALLAEGWDTVRRQGVRYVRDARAPFGAADLDTVELPPVTLASAGGDCDDLTALVATLAEAAGISTRIIKLPGHVMPAVDTGLPATAWPSLAATEDRVLIAEGRLFLPVEATATDATFWDAVRRGGQRLARDRKDAVVIDPRAAWAAHAPLEQLGEVSFVMSGEKPRDRVLVMGTAAGASMQAPMDALQRQITARLASKPALEAASEEDLRQLLQLRSAQMAAGCEAAECLTDLGRGLAARLILRGRLDSRPGSSTLSLVLVDVASASQLGASTVKGPNVDALSSKINAAVDELLAGHLRAQAAMATTASRFDEHTKAVEAELRSDGYAHARFLAMHGRLDDAEAAARGVGDPRKAALLRANLLLLRNKIDEADVLLAAMTSESARWNRVAAWCVEAGNADRCTSLARALKGRDVDAALSGVTKTEGSVGGSDEDAAARSTRALSTIERARRGEPPAGGEPGAVRYLLRW